MCERAAGKKIIDFVPKSVFQKSAQKVPKLEHNNVTEESKSEVFV